MKALSKLTSQLVLTGTIATGLLTTFADQSQASFKINPLPSNVVVSEIALSNRSGNTIFDIAATSSSFDILTKAVEAAGLAGILDSRRSLTLFAPTDSAFYALPNGTLRKLLRSENKNILRNILTYHILSGERRSSRLRSGFIETVEGSDVRIRTRNGRIRVNDATVIRTDVDASNGVVHVIDQVLIPPGLR